MEDTQVKKKRIRKKTCEIDSLEKLKSDTRTDEIRKIIKPKIGKKIGPEKDEKDINQSQISFGKFNITVKKKETMTPENLRDYYDTKFKIDDSEKTAKLMVQEEYKDAVFEPLMEDDACILKKDTKTIDEKTIDEKTKVKVKVERTNVHRILSKFIDDIKTEWPEHTDILCWWCCHSFNNPPIPCPVEYDEIRNRYKVNGIFCGWSCASAYSVKEYSNLGLIYQMKNDLCGYTDNIVIAPPKYCLKNFGGYMTIKDYRALDKSKTLLISTEGLSYVNMEIAELKHS